jgi:hypothetical protein
MLQALEWKVRITWIFEYAKTTTSEATQTQHLNGLNHETTQRADKTPGPYFETKPRAELMHLVGLSLRTGGFRRLDVLGRRGRRRLSGRGRSGRLGRSRRLGGRNGGRGLGRGRGLGARARLRARRVGLVRERPRVRRLRLVRRVRERLVRVRWLRLVRRSRPVVRHRRRRGRRWGHGGGCREESGAEDEGSRDATHVE